MADRLRGIEVFVRAINEGGLSAAARSMGMSPAMAAKHLDALESRLGVTLVHRTTRRLSLSEAGLGFFDEATRLLTELADAEAAVSARRLKVDGLLRVATPVSFGNLIVAPMLAPFQARYPDLVVELGLNDRYVDLMDEGWDLAIRIGRLKDSSLIARRLATSTSILCAAPSYLERKGVPRVLDELKDHVCLGYTLSASYGGETWGFGSDGATRVPIHAALLANNGEALAAAAIAGLGLLYGPRFIAAAAIRDGQLREIQLDTPLFDHGAIYAVTPSNRRPAAKTRAFVDYLAGELPKQQHGF